MIASHQPTMFANLPVKAAASSLEDGTMKFGAGESDERVVRNCRTFLEVAGASIDSATLLRTVYTDGATYDRILDVDKNHAGKGMLAPDTIPPSDALFTIVPRQALFLPIADCGGVVLYDNKRKVLGLIHLGRHATVDGLAKKSIAHMVKTYGSDPKDIFAWISPAISGESYWLQRFDWANQADWQPHVRAQDGGFFVDLQGYNIDRFIAAGVPKRQIERSPINTAGDPRYPSHYAFKTLGRPEKAGRFAVVAYMA